MTRSELSMIALLAALAAALALAACESESRRVREAVLPALNLSRVQDGVYTGEAAYRGHLYRVQVQVQDHRIAKLEVLASEGDRHDLAALAVLERVVAAQSLAVDAVSGATRSSKLYLIAAYQALTGRTVEY